MQDSPTSGSGSVAAIRRHPLHPFIVPIPIGALALAFPADFLAYTTGDLHYTQISGFLIPIGLATGALAGVIGVVEMMGVRRARRSSTAWAHGALNVLALMLATVGYLSRWNYMGDDAPVNVGAFQVVISGVVALLLGVSGWLGGELTFKQGIGVDRVIGVLHDGPEPR